MRSKKIVFNLDDIVSFKVGGTAMTGRINAIEDGIFYITCDGYDIPFMCEREDMELVK